MLNTAGTRKCSSSVAYLLSIFGTAEAGILDVNMKPDAVQYFMKSFFILTLKLLKLKFQSCAIINFP